MAIIKRRKLHFSTMTDFAQAGHFVELLKKQVGVTDVRFDERDGILEVSYNLQLINLEKIERLLEETGMTWPQTFWARMKRGWIHFTEENELENAQAPSMPCCSHPDEILAKGKK